MRKLPQSILGGGDEEHQQDDLLDEPEGGLCSLSPTQLLPSIYFVIYFALNLKFSQAIIKNPIFVQKPMLIFFFFLFIGFWMNSESMDLLHVYLPAWFVCSCTAFLIGPGQQIRMMLDPVRIYATAIYVGCVVIALICALLIHSKILTIIAIICEICALIWYSLSYIPFARRIVSELTVRLFDTES